MLALDDPLWHQLQHAYGPASDIPDFLRQLRESIGARTDRRELWHNLWGSLCHQESTYSASYAAVPHIIRLAIEAAAPVDFDYFALPVMIEVGRRKGLGPEVPEMLAGSYQDTLARLGEAVQLRWNDPWDRYMLRSAAAAQAVAKGDIEFAEAVMNMDDDWISRIVHHDR